jgi:ABC-type transport system involved in multi-copper enzyme maturation permease subunit
MNVFAFELRRQTRGFFIGVVVLLGTTVLFMVGAYPIYRDAKADVEQVLEGFPPQFAAAFGVTGDIFSFGGFFRFSSLYFMLIVAIMGAAWGLSVFGREKRSHTTDFLFTMPVSRARLFVAKLAACLVMIIALNALFAGTLAMIYQTYDDDPTAMAIPVGNLLLAARSLAGVQVMFLAFSMIFAAWARRIRSVSGVATAFGVLGFMLVALPELTGEEKYRIISPMSYFNVSEALEHGRYESGYMLLFAAVTIACMVVSAVKYLRSDVRA